MHTYGYQWVCQLVYNPQLREGLGLTEGEGTERIWSKLRKLIGVTRTSGVCFRLSSFKPYSTYVGSSQRSRRIWMIDRHTDVLNVTARENLGGWIRGRLKNGVEARDLAADEDLAATQVPLNQLRDQWSEQQTAQLSVRNRTYPVQSSCVRQL